MSARHPVHEKLKALPLFREFSDAELAALLELAEPTLYGTGQDIVRQGESGSSMFLIADGRAKVVLHREDGTILQLAQLGPGDFFGELSLIDQGPRTADVTATSDCTAMKISTGLLRMFAAESPAAAFKLAMAVLEIVGRRLRATNKRYLDTLSIVSVLAADATVMVPENEVIV